MNQIHKHISEMKNHANNMMSSISKMEKAMKGEMPNRNFPMKGMVKQKEIKEPKHSGEVKLHY